MDETKLKKSNRPGDSKFKQQKLPAWQPVMTAHMVLPLLFAIGIGFIPLGIGFLIAALNVKEAIVDYTNDTCVPNCGDFIQNLTASHSFMGQSCQCVVDFSLEEDFQAPVYMYYSLSNYYQNHRRYLKSLSQDQVEGKPAVDVSSTDSLGNGCEDPFEKSVVNVNVTIPYAPCGALANSLFNDTLGLQFKGNANQTLFKPIPIRLLKTGIAWASDQKYMFNNPPGSDENLSQIFENTAKPRDWQRPVFELDPSDPENNGYNNEDLIVWMRHAAMPTFRKLYRRIDHTAEFKNGLPAGNYSLLVTYNYPVVQFKGIKRMILTTTSFLGGKNPFMGIAYIVVGAICLIAGVVLAIIHKRIGRSSTSMVHEVVDNSTPYYDSLGDEVRPTLAEPRTPASSMYT